MRLLPVLAIALVACVEPRGSVVTLTLGPAVQVPGGGGGGRPPTGSHYLLVAAQGRYAYPLVEFEIRPLVDVTDRCFVEPDGARYPGLHSARLVARLTADGASADELAAAAEREATQLLLGELKAVVAHEPGFSNDLRPGLWSEVPDPALVDDASNAERRRACRALWSTYPGYYVGDDLAPLAPRAGELLGLVDGVDPRSGARVGGVTLQLAETLTATEVLRITWHSSERELHAPPLGESDLGELYLAGAVSPFVAGVATVALSSPTYPNLRGTATLVDLAADEVD